MLRGLNKRTVPNVIAENKALTGEWAAQPLRPSGAVSAAVLAVPAALMRTLSCVS